MGVRQTVAEWIGIAKDTLDFGREFSTAIEAHRLKLAKRLAKLQFLPMQARKALHRDSSKRCFWDGT